jgi:CO/xanthine dehydrogenase Mo-binding subunit
MLRACAVRQAAIVTYSTCTRLWPPEAGLAVPAEDGGVDVYVTTQWLHVDREQIAPCLGLPEDKVRLHLAGVGGEFGSREDIHMQVHACVLALRTGRPVKFSYGREESFYGHVHRHPSRIWVRHGARRDGQLVTVDARLLFDGGAYASSSRAVVGNAATFAAGPYEVPNVRVEGTVVYTNNPPCGGSGLPRWASRTRLRWTNSPRSCVAARC